MAYLNPKQGVNYFQVLSKLFDSYNLICFHSRFQFSVSSLKIMENSACDKRLSISRTCGFDLVI